MQDRVNFGYADVYMLGTYRYHRSETLLIITLPDYLEYCPEIREYAQNFSVVLEQVNVERSKLFAKSRKTILSNSQQELPLQENPVMHPPPVQQHRVLKLHDAIPKHGTIDSATKQ